MNKRERTLLIAVVSITGLGLSVRVVYPQWIAPLFDFDRQVQDLEATLKDLNQDIQQQDKARHTYREYVYRTGGDSEKDVADQFNSTLMELVDQCRLEDKKVTPKGSSTDRKTGLITLSYSISGKGPLEHAVLFLKRFYELPYVTQLKSLKLVPQKAPRRNRRSRDKQPVVNEERVALTGSIDVLVLPPMPGIEVADPEGHQDPLRVKYRNRGYASIWAKRAFTRPSVAPPPPPSVEEIVDTAPPPPKIPGWQGDPQRHQKQIAGCWATTEEVTVVNTASKQREYVRVGEQLDGGELLMVHPYGALVRRTDGETEQEYLYPWRELMADAVALNRAPASQLQLRAVAADFLAHEVRDEPKVPPGPPVETPKPPIEPVHRPDASEGDAPKEVPSPKVPAAKAPRPKEPERAPEVKPASPPAIEAADVPVELAGPPVELAGPLSGEENDPTASAPPPAEPKDGAGEQDEEASGAADENDA
ncbi:MAG: hypothetical protein GY842_07300 [bacterium]|nr:hypothetical protein [bacterium]